MEEVNVVSFADMQTEFLSFSFHALKFCPEYILRALGYYFYRGHV